MRTAEEKGVSVAISGDVVLMNRVYFTSDLHFGHASVLKYSLRRPFVDKVEMAEHDDWLLDLWWRTVDSGDTVYLLGDLTAYKGEAVCQLLEKLPGRKILIEGNHDAALNPYCSYFQTVRQLKEVCFKPCDYPFLKEDFWVVMCHYPMLSWNKKQQGAIMLHGHCHGTLDKYNLLSKDLRFDVGIDGTLANLRFLTLEDIYHAAMQKIKRNKCNTFAEYSKIISRNNNRQN